MNNFSSDQPMDVIPLTVNGTPSTKRDCAKPNAQDTTNDEQGALQEQNRPLFRQEIGFPSTTTDLVFGRGGFEGSIFKSVVESHAKEYSQSKRIHKSEMIIEIYEELKNRKCRFISKVYDDSTMACKLVIVTDKDRVINRIKYSMKSYIRKVLKRDDAKVPPIMTKKESLTNKRTNESYPDWHDQRNKRQCFTDCDKRNME